MKNIFLSKYCVRTKNIVSDVVSTFGTLKSVKNENQEPIKKS